MLQVLNGVSYRTGNESAVYCGAQLTRVRPISRKPTIVAAGFGSWALANVNPAAQAVTGLMHHRFKELDLHCLEVPVDTNALYGWLENTLLTYKPDIWIGVGVAVKSPAILIENVGINIRCFDTPDINGTTMTPNAIVDDGLLAYRSNLPTQSIVQNLRSAGIPADLSFHAGTHLCNQMLYSVLYLSQIKSLNLISGFVHVPQSTDNVASSGIGAAMGSSMPVSMMTQALAIAVDSAVEQLDG